MEDFVAYPSRWRVALAVLGSITFVAMGLWMIGAFGEPPIELLYSPAVTFAFGWICTAFFGLCGISAAKMLFDTDEQLHIGSAGIRWARWSDQIIPWSEISDVTTWSYTRQKFIILHLCDPGLFPGRGIVGVAGRANRALTGGDIGISLGTTDRSFYEAMSAIETFRFREGEIIH